jgi:hypothetical protein
MLGTILSLVQPSTAGDGGAFGAKHGGQDRVGRQ